MKRVLVLFAIAALALPATAAAKGPTGASIEGPGAGGGININGDGETPTTQLGNLAMVAGLPDALFEGNYPNQMQTDRPKGKLGPKYTITWTLPGPEGTEHMRQDVYPYANPPVSYLEPGVKFFGEMRTRGGWFVGTSALKDALVDAGLPPTPAATPTADNSTAVSTSTILAIVAAMAVLLLGTALLVRRRTRPAAAA